MTQQEIDNRLKIMRSEFNEILKHWEGSDISKNVKRVETMAFNGFARLVELKDKLENKD